MNYIKIFYIILTSTKFKFSKPKEVDILLYDQGVKFNKIIKSYFKKYKKTILYSRFEELNIYIIFSILIKFKFLNNCSLFQNYIIEYCELAKPKIIISSTLWDAKLLSLKKKLNFKTKIILVQPFPVRKKYFKILKEKYEVDYIFHMDNAYTKILKKYFFSKYVKLGSFANNQIKVKKKKNKNILLISGFRTNFFVKNPTSEWELLVEHEKQLVKILAKKITKGVKFRVLIKPFVDLKDYCEIMECSKTIVIPNNNINPYNIMDEHSIIITMNNGTMGHEAIARRIKHIRVCRENIFISGNFFEVRKKANLKKFLERFYKMPTKKFFEICHKEKIDIFPYNYDNLILRNLITKIIR